MQIRSSTFQPAQLLEQREHRAELLTSRGKLVLLMMAIATLIAFVLAYGCTSPSLGRAVKWMLIALVALSMLVALAIVIANATR